MCNMLLLVTISQSKTRMLWEMLGLSKFFSSSLSSIISTLIPTSRLSNLPRCRSKYHKSCSGLLAQPHDSSSHHSKLNPRYSAPQEVKLLVNLLPNLSLRQLLNIPRRPSRATMQERRLLGRRPQCELARQAIWMFCVSHN